MIRTKIFKESGHKLIVAYEEFEKENDVIDVKELKNPSSAYPLVWVRYKPREDVIVETGLPSIGSDIDVEDRLARIVEHCVKVQFHGKNGLTKQVKYIGV